jgi:uncharacterized protein
MVDGGIDRLADRLLDGLDGLLDGHCHLVFAGELDQPAFERLCTEADTPAPAGTSHADSQLGLAIRRWCAPVLDLEPHSPLPAYLARRAELGAAEANRRLLRGAGLTELLVDTGITGDGFLTLAALGEAASAPVREVVRLESVAEGLAGSGMAASEFPEAYRSALDSATLAAVAAKSVLAYRHGFDVDPARPDDHSVVAAAAHWLASGLTRLTDPVLLRFVLWCGLDTGLPVQLHCGFGDRDLWLPRANPALLQPLLTAAEPTGVPIVLLHCYPYHREAGWLASVFAQVYVDVGLTMSYAGARAAAVLGEFCELAPFGKLLFSTDAYGLAELYAVGAAQFTHAIDALLRAWHRDGAISMGDAERFAAMIAAGNARRVYQL